MDLSGDSARGSEARDSEMGDGAQARDGEDADQSPDKEEGGNGSLSEPPSSTMPMDVQERIERNRRLALERRRAASEEKGGASSQQLSEEQRLLLEEKRLAAQRRLHERQVERERR